jgi:spore coat polysaccharide biosynthesis protein SpsF
MNYISAAIVIQARSTSKRFPGKIFERIGAKQILQHVIDACSNSAAYINAYTNQHGVVCGVSLCVPTGDALIVPYSKQNIIQGPEDDVLKRYILALDKLQADYIVRITSDCPFIPPFVISKAVTIAVKDKLDYLTNADPRYRTAPDGHDVEVISARLLRWLDENATSPSDREHVTSYLVDHLPDWASKADIIGFADLRDVKLSVDTREDLDRMVLMFNRLYSVIKMSPKSYRL